MTGLLLKLFVKNSDNTNDPAVRSACGKLSGAVGIAANVLLCIAKFLIGTLSGAVSIAADAVNNLSDAASSVVTLLGFKLSEKPADEEHPFGHARIEYLTGLAVSAMILIIGALLAYSSFKKLISPHPEQIEVSVVIIVVLLLSIGVKLWLSLFNTKLGKRIDSASLLATAADSRNDMLSTGAVLLSCLASLLLERLAGIEIGGYIDGGMGILVALFILWSGWGIAKETISPLLGESASEELVSLVRSEIEAYDGVLGLHDLIVHDYGPGQRFATVHIEMDYRVPPLEAHDLIDNIEIDFYKRQQIQLTVHYDPVVVDDPELNRLRDKMRAAAEAINPVLSLHDFRMVRGETHTNLIFDLAIPFEYKSKEKWLHEQLQAALADEEKTYYTVITFDLKAFN